MASWDLISSAASFPVRDSSRVFQMGGRAYVATGYQYGGVALRDAWSSSNGGATWTQVASDGPFGNYPMICPVGKVLYAVGCSHFQNGMWKSLDGGVTWSQIMTTLPCFVDGDSPLLDVEGELLLIVKGAAWAYDEQANIWSQRGMVPNAPRLYPKAAVLHGRIFLIGGIKEEANVPAEGGYTQYTTLRDVWVSDDAGATWEKVCEGPWAHRMWFGLIAHCGGLYIVGGYNNVAPGNFCDTWFSPDGEKWCRVEVTSAYTARHAPGLFSHNGRLVLTTGNANPTGTTLNDVWELRP